MDLVKEYGLYVDTVFFFLNENFFKIYIQSSSHTCINVETRGGVN